MAEEKIYVFIGEGAGIPGLPHEVTKAEAAVRKVGDVLEEALKKGVYAEKKGKSLELYVKKAAEDEPSTEPEKE